jgi:hypothetical protein
MKYFPNHNLTYDKNNIEFVIDQNFWFLDGICNKTPKY